MRTVQRLTTCLALAAGIALVASPTMLSAQETVPSRDAEAFMGNWELPLTTDMGPVEVTMEIVDMDGQVAATVGSLEGTAPVQDISIDGGDMILDFQMDAQGQMMPIVMTLSPEGEDLAVTVDVAQGMFVATGTATRTDE